MPSFLLCMHPIARDILLTLIASGILLALTVALARKRLFWIPFAVCVLLIAAAAWLGSYKVSPLGFSSGRIPLLSGFWITRAQRPRTWVAPMQVVSVAEGSAMGIELQRLPGPVNCMWSSSNGGALDDPASCDTAYTPGQGASFDVLRVTVRSACGLPPALGEMRISVLP